jgi:DNA replication and repair protein RecF
LLTQLSIENLRNLSELSLEVSEGLSVFTGFNGAGKTSVLDAVHILGTGKSFTTSQLSKAIRDEQPGLQVVGRMKYGGAESVIGISRLRAGGGETRLSGAPVKALSELARELPLVLLNADSLNSLREGPEARRRMIDQMVFHVEHFFVSSWQRYHQALKQRNILLRKTRDGDDGVWIGEMAAAGERVHEARERVTALLSDELAAVLASMDVDFPGMSLVLRSGWAAGESLTGALNASVQSDRQRGFTQVGPHRADLQCLLGSRPANEVLSRGQMKVLMSALRVAQGRVLAAVTGRPPIFLLDDVGAELDQQNARAVFSVLAADRFQVLATMVSLGNVPEWINNTPITVFHVEQGVITETNSVA